jgi:hypothetical protein
MLGYRVEDKVLIGGVGEETGLEGHGGAVGVGEVTADHRPENLLVSFVDQTVHPFRARYLLQMVIATDLEPGYPEHREAVVATVLDGEVEHGKTRTYPGSS